MSTPLPVVDVDLVVVGGGPTGLAALFQAGREGIGAVGLEAGPGPAASIREYLNGLVLISRPTDYEVAGIPLDCRDPNQLTREEVLHYLGRVVNYGDLDLRCNEPCLRLVPPEAAGEAVLVHTSRQVWRARQVVVTTWYRRRRLPDALRQGAEGIEVIEALHDGVAAAGRSTVVLGGGLSAFEQATAVMMHGQAVTIVSRHVLPSAFRTAHFEALLRATGSEVVEGAADLRFEEGSLTFGGPPAGAAGGQRRAIRCEVLVACLGQEVDPDVLGMLAAAGVVSAAEIDQVRSSPTPDSMIRHGRSIGEAIGAALNAWPDFRTRLLGGVNGIRLAGGGLHIGGAHSGVKVSIETARVAVRDIAGRPLPDYLAGPPVPLPLALARFVQSPPAEPSPSLLGPLRPLRITSWTRTTMALRSRDNFEARPQAVDAGQGPGGRSPGPSPYLLVPEPEDPRVRRILALSDGSHSVDAIARELGDPSETGVRRLLGPLRFLWQNNALTWLPPARLPGAGAG
jgi:hypothetical protein